MHPSNKAVRTISLPVLIALTLGCFGLSPQARAVCQEGCLTNENTALGDDALLSNTTGFQNTATGKGALFSNTTGVGNTATGANALVDSTTANVNTATGSGALQNTTSGSENTATGAFAALSNTTGENNTAIGLQALEDNKAGNNNTAVGRSALLLTSGSSNIALGSSAGVNITTGSNNIDIGNAGVEGETGIIRIGTAGSQTATFIAGIRETPLAQGVALAVGITADGQLGVRASSERFKEAIKPMGKASEAILSLKPVIFHYKKELDPHSIPQFGLVAEEVAKVNPDLVARDASGKPFTVRYDEVNAMLLNEFLKEHRKVETLEHALAQQQNESRADAARQQVEIDNLKTALKEQTAQIQKVSDQLVASQTVPPMLVESR
jgi:hypothetical protein